jgi:chromosome segregation ATPase
MIAEWLNSLELTNKLLGALGILFSGAAAFLALFKRRPRQSVERRDRFRSLQLSSEDEFDFASIRRKLEEMSQFVDSLAALERKVAHLTDQVATHDKKHDQRYRVIDGLSERVHQIGALVASSCASIERDFSCHRERIEGGMNDLRRELDSLTLGDPD